MAAQEGGVGQPVRGHVWPAGLRLQGAAGPGRRAGQVSGSFFFGGGGGGREGFTARQVAGLSAECACEQVTRLWLGCWLGIGVVGVGVG